MARSLNGSSDFIDCGGTALYSPPAITVSVWANITSLANTYSCLATKLGCYQSFVKSTGGLAFYLGTSAGGPFYDGSGSHTLTTNKWYNILFVYSSVVGLIGYLNGAQDGAAGAAGTLTSNTSDLFVGKDPGTPGRLVSGSLNDQAIWNTVLSPAEIAAIAAGERPSRIRPGSLVGYWPFDASPIYAGLDRARGNIGVLTGTALSSDAPLLRRQLTRGRFAFPTIDPIAFAVSVSGASTVALAALGKIMFGARAAAAGSVGVAARSAIVLKGRSVLVGAAPLAGRSMALINARGAPTGAAALAGRGTVKGTGRAGPSGVVPLAARVAAAVAARANPSGTVPLAARSAVVTTGRANMSVVTALVALGGAAIAMVKGRGGLSGTVGLAARSSIISTGRGGLVGVAALAGRAAATIKSRVSVGAALALTASSMISARGRGAMAGVVGLAGRAKASAAGSGAISGIANLVSVAARAVIMVTARARLAIASFGPPRTGFTIQGVDPLTPLPPGPPMPFSPAIDPGYIGPHDKVRRADQHGVVED